MSASYPPDVSTFNPALYECVECNAKPGSPELCRRCFAARSAAGDAWVGSRRLFPRHAYVVGCGCDPCTAERAPKPLTEPVPLIRCCCNRKPCECWYGLQHAMAAAGIPATDANLDAAREVLERRPLRKTRRRAQTPKRGTSP